ncbi:BA14K family protein [Mesorhizobium sp. M1329]|uniref:BA14K family protein n=1 Tax=Mesorhizobium sp. M1329 TaxID=2957083 RepID=UPI003336977E
MKPLFLSSVGSGLMALGLIAGLSVPSLAGPMPKPLLPVAGNAADIVQIREDWAGGNDRQIWRWRNHGFRQWHGGDDWRWRSHNFRGRHFSRHWDNGGWDDSWRWRHHRRHYRGGYYDDSAGAAILGLGLGLGLGSLYNNNNYYDAPPPRRYYRAGRLSSAHVQWCYNRYRSYRAWDNTFQPYNGPRQQCYSPYS